LNPTTGVISSAPKGSGTFSFTVEVVNAAGSVTKDFTLVIAELPVAPTTTTIYLSDGYIGALYNYTLMATGTSPLKWSIVSGELPDGFTLDSSTGVISGTPSKTIGDHVFTVKVENSVGSDTKRLTLVINSGIA
jgi:hypothetical protein